MVVANKTKVDNSVRTVVKATPLNKSRCQCFVNNYPLVGFHATGPDEVAAPHPLKTSIHVFSTDSILCYHGDNNSPATGQSRNNTQRTLLSHTHGRTTSHVRLTD